jgi:hypothetical protein
MPARATGEQPKKRPQIFHEFRMTEKGRLTSRLTTDRLKAKAEDRWLLHDFSSILSDEIESIHRGERL